MKPQRILEIGTHLGASTLAFAAALEELDEGGMMTTVDVVDVNDEDLGHWRQFAAPFSPAGGLKMCGLARRVKFVQETALEALTLASGESYDLILLDGDHGATAVCREIPAALRVVPARFDSGRSCRSIVWISRRPDWLRRKRVATEEVEQLLV
jgi:predicted O-methyltransferase YrrM